jgi:CheY-like chemotaxis protein
MTDTPTPIAGRKKLVVVEDDPETRDVEMFLLASEGYEVVGVADGERAAETIRDARADLVVLDLMLPKKDGLEVLAELTREPSTAHVPVMVVSAYVTRLGARDPLRHYRQVKRIFDKPFDITELLDAVEHELGAPA